MKKFTNEQWNAMTEEEKINEIKASFSKFEAIFLPGEGQNMNENAKLERKAGAYCAIQYYF